MTQPKDQSYIPQAFDFEKKAALFIIGISIKHNPYKIKSELSFLRLNPDEKTNGDIDIRIRFGLYHYLIQVKSNKKLKNITGNRCKEGIIQLFERFKDTFNNNIKSSEIMPKYWLVYEGNSNDEVVNSMSIWANKSDRTDAKGFWRKKIEGWLEHENDVDSKINQFVEKLWILPIPQREYVDLMNREQYGSDYEKFLGKLVYDSKISDPDLLKKITRKIILEDQNPKLELEFIDFSITSVNEILWKTNDKLINIERKRHSLSQPIYEKKRIDDYIEKCIEYNQKLIKISNLLNLNFEIANEGTITAKDIFYNLELSCNEDIEVFDEDSIYILESETEKEPKFPKPMRHNAPSSIFKPSFLSGIGILSRYRDSFSIEEKTKKGKKHWNMQEEIGSLNPDICISKKISIHIPKTDKIVVLKFKIFFSMENSKQEEELSLQFRYKWKKIKKIKAIPMDH